MPRRLFALKLALALAALAGLGARALLASVPVHRTTA